MLLIEVLRKPIPNLKISGKNPIPDIMSPKHHQIIGTGAQALAYLHRKFPNKIIKTIQVQDTNDPQYQYLRLCLKHQNNPYFPKIFRVKLFKTKKDSDDYSRYDISSQLVDLHGIPFEDMLPYTQKFTLFVIMERLQPLTRFDPQLIRELNIVPSMDYLSSEDKSYLHVTTDPLGFMISCAFHNPKYRKQIITSSTDQNLRQAIRLMEPLFRHFYSDMHMNNIMTRDPKQLVFLDPFSEE